MKGIIFAVAAMVVALVWCTGVQAAEPNMKDGLWEITTKMEMKGMPANVPPTVVKQCLTKKDSVPQQDAGQKNTNCKMTEQKVSGDTVSWAMVCKEKESTTEGKGRIIYKGDTFDGTMTTTMKDKSGSHTVNTKMSGKRLGPCKK